MTEEQCEAPKSDPLIQAYGVRRFLGMPTDIPFNKSHAEIGYSNANQAHWSYCDPVEGRLPQEGTNEAATDTHVLELLGIEPELGAQFTIPFDVDGHETTQTFTLCGWWEYDEAVVANHILIPQSQLEEILNQVGGKHEARPIADDMEKTDRTWLSVPDTGKKLYLHRYQLGLHRSAAYR